MNSPIYMVVDSGLFGGIERHILALCELLQQQNLVPEVVFLRDHGNQYFYKKLASLGVAQHVLNGRFITLMTFIKTRPNTVFHTHGYKAGILTRLACALLNRKCISTFHAGDKGVGMVYYYNLLDKLTGYLSSNFVVSKNMLLDVPNAEFMANFLALHDADQPPIHTSNGEKVRISFIGRLSYEKGPDRFCMLAERLAHNTKLEFHLYGDGPMRSELQEKYQQYAYFHGFSEAHDAFTNTDLFVISSREEGLPMASLEALYYQVPTLTWQVGQLESVVLHEQTGLLLPQYDHDAFSEQIESFANLSAAQRNQLSSSCHAHLRREFGGTQQFEQLINKYQLVR